MLRRELRQRTRRFRLRQPRQFFAQQAVDLEALARKMPPPQTTTHGRVGVLPSLLMMLQVGGKQPAARRNRADAWGLQQVHPLVEIADGSEFFADLRQEFLD